MFIRLDGTLSQAREIIRTLLDRHPRFLIIIIGLVAFTVFTAYSVERYLAFQTNFFDLGLDSNSIWRTVNGYESWSSLIFPSTPGHINHISPILGLVALVYAIVPDPKTLLVIQAAAVTLAIVPLYLIAIRETHSPLVSLVVAGLYLLNPGLHGIIRYDFHPEAFIPLFVFLVYYFYTGSRPELFYLSVGLMLATIEYSAVLGVGIAFSLWLTNKGLDRRILTTLLSSLFLFVIIIMSTVGRAFEAFSWPSNWLAVQFFGTASSQNTSYLQTVAGFWNNPGILLTFVQYDITAKATYLLIVTAPAWLAAVKYYVRMVPALPWLAVVLISSRYSYSSIDFQYSVFLIPFIYLAAIPFFSGIRKRKKLLVSLAALGLCVMLLYSAISPVGPHPQWPQPNPIFISVASISNSIPQNATILTQSDLYPQLSNKAYVTINYSLPQPPQYILVNTDTSWYDWTNPSLGYPLSTHQQLERFTSNYMYSLTFADLGLKLYELEKTSLTNS
jgi:uncharacterized membrane protein